MPDCVFCEIIAGKSPATVVHEWTDAVAIVPLRPCTEGHTLVIPRRHVRDATVDPDVTAATARRAADLASGRQCHLITNAGPDAEQTVYHLHWHVIPRASGDGLDLWPRRDKERTQAGSAARWRQAQKEDAR